MHKNDLIVLTFFSGQKNELKNYENYAKNASLIVNFKTTALFCPNSKGLRIPEYGSYLPSFLVIKYLGHGEM